MGGRERKRDGPRVTEVSNAASRKQEADALMVAWKGSDSFKVQGQTVSLLLSHTHFTARLRNMICY